MLKTSQGHINGLSAGFSALFNDYSKWPSWDSAIPLPMAFALKDFLLAGIDLRQKGCKLRLTNIYRYDSVF